MESSQIANPAIQAGLAFCLSIRVACAFAGRNATRHATHVYEMATYANSIKVLRGGARYIYVDDQMKSAQRPRPTRACPSPEIVRLY